MGGGEEVEWRMWPREMIVRNQGGERGREFRCYITWVMMDSLSASQPVTS